MPALKAGRAARDSIMAEKIEMSGDGDSRVVVLHCCLCWTEAVSGNRVLNCFLR